MIARRGGGARRGRGPCGALVLAGFLSVLGACASAPPVVPARPSFTDSLLAVTPQGADILMELHLDRLRQNPTVGPFLTRLAGHPGVSQILGFDPLGEADGVALSVYGIGGGEGQVLVVLRGDRLDALAAARKRADAEALDGHTLVVGPDALRARAIALGRGGGPSALHDRALIALRDLPVPDGAPGASLRLTARPSFQARVAAASRTGWEDVPVQFAAWLDIADDLAVVAVWQSEDPRAADRFVARLEKLAMDPAFGPWGRALWARSKIVRAGARTRWTCVVGPKALAAWRDSWSTP